MMKRKRHTEEQIIAILKDHETGMETVAAPDGARTQARMLDNAALKDLGSKK
jgi:hypothetical protein